MYDDAKIRAGQADGAGRLATDSWPGMRAITIAEGDPWPEPSKWDHGPDPLTWPQLYDDEDQDDDDELT